MTVNVTKPQINVREKLSELDKPSGIAGEAILRSETPQEVFNYIGAGRRNLLINGDFQIAQRSAGPVTGSNYTTVDRWIFPLSSETSQQVTNDRVSNKDKMLKVTADSNGYGILYQKVENVRTCSDGYATLSFWAKTSDANALRLEIQQNFGSGGSAVVTVINDNSFFKVPNSDWNFYSYTAFIPSVVGKTIGSNNFLSILFGSQTGQPNANVVHYSEVQLEVGKVATPFEHRSYGEELALCQRYYYKITGGSTDVLGIGGNCESTTSAFGSTFFPVQMRTTPTSLEQSGDATDYRVFHSATTTLCSAVPTFNAATTDRIAVTSFTVASGLTQHRPSQVGSANSDGYLAWSAEL